MKSKQIAIAYRISAVTNAGASIRVDFANGMRHTPLPPYHMLAKGDFLVNYHDADSEFFSAAEFAALIGVSIDTAATITSVAAVTSAPPKPLDEQFYAIRTATGVFTCTRDWMNRYAPEVGELVADIEGGEPRYLPVRLLSRRSNCAVAGENTIENLLAEMDDSGASGWAHRLRELVSGELARRETFVVSCAGELSPDDLAVFRKHWEAMRTGAAPMPVLMASPAPAGTPAAQWRVKGEEDPHAGHYDGERAALAMGNLTDDELANAAFMNYDSNPSMADMIAGKAFRPIVYMTAVKERIRWLSRALERSLDSKPTPLEPLLAGLFDRAALPRTDMLPTKVFKEALEAKIVARSYDVRPDGRTTVCELTALNGTTERGESSAVSASEFNREMGEKYAYEDALRKLWAKEGYLLRELRFRAQGSAAI